MSREVTTTARLRFGIEASMWPINPSRRHSIPVCTVFYRRVCHQEMLLGAACRPTATSWSIDCYTSPGTLLEAIIPALDPHTQPLPGNPPTASMDSCAVNPQTGQDLQCMQRSKPPPPPQLTLRFPSPSPASAPMFCSMSCRRIPSLCLASHPKSSPRTWLDEKSFEDVCSSSAFCDRAS